MKRRLLKKKLWRKGSFGIEGAEGDKSDQDITSQVMHRSYTVYKKLALTKSPTNPATSSSRGK